MEKTDPVKQQEGEILPLDRQTDTQSESAFRNMLQLK